MRTRLFGVISLINLALTSVWLILLIIGIQRSGPVETFEQAIASVSRLDWLFYLTYINAAFITITAAMLFAGLYLYCKSASPGWSMVGLVFVPVYAILGLVSYLSQITVVPRVIALSQISQYDAVSDILLGLVIQQWPGSIIAFLNTLAYAILAIPSIIFGILLLKGNKLSKFAGALLALNGIFCIIGLTGIILENSLLGMGSAIGGAIYLFALIPLSLMFLREEDISSDKLS